MKYATATALPDDLRMTRQQLRAAYPHVMAWITRTLDAHAHNARTVASQSFSRLPLYFGRELLAVAKFVVVDRVPMPPLTELGLREFAAFERADSDGVTYLDTYFVRRLRATEEQLHFHELIHVIQWRLLGPERFLSTYVAGLEAFGYRNSPLEAMAYDAEALFAQGREVFDAEQWVAALLARMDRRAQGRS
jgi:hypothetical protein